MKPLENKEFQKKDNVRNMEGEKGEFPEQAPTLVPMRVKSKDS